MLHIGIDDTDSLDGGCTTWLITEIISELSDLDLIAPPRLVRLNPNVPWKTRGNGALALVFGEGIGSKKKIGSLENSEISIYPNYKDSLIFFILDIRVAFNVYMIIKQTNKNI